MLDLNSLNNNQCKAVEWDEGALLLLAGPGSGKTKVLTTRIARLVSDSAGKHFKILGLTFTNKAAAEMKDRISNLVPDASERITIATFHSFAASILRQHGNHIGLKPDFTILTQNEDRHSILSEALAKSLAEALAKSLEKSSAANYGSDLSSERLLPLITRWIENDVKPEDAPAIIQKCNFDEPEIIAMAYKYYRQLMIEKNVLDFPSLVSEALRLLQTHKGVKRHIQIVYPYICVDEFQDTNTLQYKILQQIVNKDTNNLFVVADDDQVIYQWNGASPSRLRSLADDSKITVLQLPENYRCPAAVVDLANKLISNNTNRLPKKSNAVAEKNPLDGATNAIVLNGFSTFKEEVEWVAESIAALPSEEQSNCVVLARFNFPLKEMVRALKAKKVVGYLASRKSEFESPPISWLHAMLRLANARGSREYLHTACKFFYSLQGVNLNIEDIMSQAKVSDGDYLRGWARSALQRKSDLDDCTITMINNAVLKLSERLDFKGFINESFRWFDELADMPDDIFDRENYASESKTWNDLIDEIQGEPSEGGNLTLHALLQGLDQRSKTDPAPKKGVPCFTIHGAKGLEFNHVYLISLVEDQLPSWAAVKKGDDSEEMQEERRNCFVALTRTQKTLTLSYSKEVGGYSKEPSRFLFEMGLLV